MLGRCTSVTQQVTWVTMSIVYHSFQIFLCTRRSVVKQKQQANSSCWFEKTRIIKVHLDLIVAMPCSNVLVKYNGLVFSRLGFVFEDPLNTDAIIFYSSHMRQDCPRFLA